MATGSPENTVEATPAANLLRKALNLQTRAGDHETGVDGLTLHIRKARTEPLHCVYTLSVAMVLQGSKEVSFGKNLFHCRAGQSMLSTLDLPVVSHICKASAKEPFVALLLKIEPSLVFKTAAEMQLDDFPDSARYQPVTTKPMDKGLAEVFSRLLHLAIDDKLKTGLEPLIKKEIVIRLLDGSHGTQLRYLASAGSPPGQISQAVTWLKQNFTESFSMDELAERAHMSASTFRHHFKSITGTSPLQYQKTLRLQEARDLMLLQNLDARRAGLKVGYESPSQFSREYSRHFGSPPQKDIRELRINWADLNR